MKSELKQKTQEEQIKKKSNSGIPMTEEELADYYKTFSDIEESIAYALKHAVKGYQLGGNK